MKKRIISAILALAMAFSLVGCSSSSSDTSGSSSSSSDEVIEITFWHSMSGDGGTAVETFVADFNATHENIVVTAEYQGEYDDAITKMKATAGTSTGPDLMQVYDIGTSWMIDSGYIIPMQDLIDEAGYDTSAIEENIASYYTVDGTLYSMPFNSSTPLMYYNADAFEEVGLDPENPPTTFDELEEAATLLTTDDKSGMTMTIYGWYFEQYLSNQGLDFVNNGNGRDDTATAVEFDSNGGGLEFFTRLYEMSEAGINGVATTSVDIGSAFVAGETQIIFASTASLTYYQELVGDNFTLAVAALPDILEDYDGGVSIGGGSLWAIDNGDDARAAATWEFVEYLASPEVQVAWNQATGYFPITTEAYELEEMQEHLEENPLFQVAIDQLHASSPNDSGALLGVFTEARSIIQTNWELMCYGDLTPEEAVETSATQINTAIESYNISNG